MLTHQDNEVKNSLKQRLFQIGVQDPSYEARIILSYTADEQEIERVLQRRSTFEPLSKIFEDKGFYRHSFITTKDTLDPRPDSELFIEILEKTFSQDSALTLADFGVGTGCLLFSALLHFKNWTGTGYDMSDAALDVARRNIEKFTLQDRVRLEKKDCFVQPSFSDSFDVVLANPPYLSAAEYEQIDAQTMHDPKMSLTISDDGLSPYCALSRDVSFLKPGGFLLLEVGYTQSQEVQKIFQHLEFLGAEKDFGGHTRILTYRRN